MGRIRVIGLDCDDTLWHTESIFWMTQERFADLVEPYLTTSIVDATERLNSTEIRNLRLFGYGVKGFTLSMIETAIELTDATIPTSAIRQIIEFGKAILDHPVEVIEGVADTIEMLAADYRLIAITKGDLFDQESKLAGSGLGEHIWKVEVLAEKDPNTYRRVLERNNVAVDEFAMVGNSIKSDILPVLELGGSAVHVPYPLVWAHEDVEELPASDQFVQVERFTEIPRVISKWSAK